MKYKNSSTKAQGYLAEEKKSYQKSLKYQAMQRSETNFDPATKNSVREASKSIYFWSHILRG